MVRFLFSEHDAACACRNEPFQLATTQRRYNNNNNNNESISTAQNKKAWCYPLCARTVPSAPEIVIPRARAHGK